MERTPGPPSVLLVEDEETLRVLLEIVLRAAGYHVAVAADGIEALEVAAAGAAHDVVVTDLMMPRLDGLELCRRLRGDGFTGAIVLVTASVDRDGDAAAAGADDLIRKPFRPQELQARVDALLERRGAAA